MNKEIQYSKYSKMIYLILNSFIQLAQEHEICNKLKNDEIDSNDCLMIAC